MGEIFANEATDKELISKIYKQLMQLNIKKTKTNKSPHHISPKKTYRWPTNMKRCSTSLIIRET